MEVAGQESTGGSGGPPGLTQIHIPDNPVSVGSTAAKGHNKEIPQRLLAKWLAMM